MPKHQRKEHTDDDGDDVDRRSSSVAHDDNDKKITNKDKTDDEQEWTVEYMDVKEGRGGGQPKPKRRKALPEEEAERGEEGGEEEDEKLRSEKALAKKLGYSRYKSPFHLHDGAFRTGSQDRWYKVLPTHWKNIRSYLSFEWLGIKHCVSDFIDVRGEANRRYIGRIIDIRATDTQHVSLLVSWMYFPRELPDVRQSNGKWVKGKQSYHGQRELVASNHMDVIPAYSVNAAVKVVHWREQEDAQDAEEDSNTNNMNHEWGSYFWRQFYDLKTQELSAATPICACKMPENPDRALIQCSNNDCAEWLHKECIEKDARRKAMADMYNRSSPPDTRQQRPGEEAPDDNGLPTPAREKPRKIKQRPRRDGATHSQGNNVIATLIIYDNGKNSSKIVLKSCRRGSSQMEREWEVPAYCLICGEEIK